MKLRVLALILLSLLLAFAPFAASSSAGVWPGSAASPNPAATGTPHAPILIDGDVNFTAANGVTGGSGAAADPFVIEGWDINGSAHDYPAPFEIINTQAAFLIRNVSVHDYGGTLPILGAIDLENVSGGRLDNVTVTNATFGLGLNRVSQLLVTNSTFALIQYDVWGVGVANSTFRTNAFHDTIQLQSSQDVVIRDSRVLGAVDLRSSLRISVLANGEIAGGISIMGDTAAEYGSHTIAPDNLVNGLPIRYFANAAGLVVDGITAGEVIVANSSSVLVSNLIIAGWPSGIFLAFVRGGLVTANNLTDGGQGVVIESSSDVVVESNNVTYSAFGYGIRVEGSTRARIENNAISAFFPAAIWVYESPNASIVGNHVGLALGEAPPGRGIDLMFSPGALVADNVLEGLWYGAVATLSENVTVRGNRFSAAVIGLDLEGAPNATVEANVFQGAGLQVAGTPFDPSRRSFNVSVTPDNLVNGRPLLYYHHCTGLTLDGTIAGQVVVADCSGVQLRHLNVSGLAYGILLSMVNHTTVEDSEMSGTNCCGLRVEWSSNVTLASNHVTNGIESYATSYLTIDGNNVSGAVVGLYVVGGNHTTVRRNTISNAFRGVNLLYVRNATVVENEIAGDHLGMYVGWVQDVHIYHNNFVSNNQSAYQDPSTNVSWDAGYPSGGNYWSDYHGTDVCSGPNQTTCQGGDGIGDTPYVVASNAGRIVDRYPLMAPYVPPPEVPGLSPYVVLGVGSGIGAAVAVGVYLLWRARRHRESPGPPGLPSETPKTNGR